MAKEKNKGIRLPEDFGKMRGFESGATRNSDANKIKYSRHLDYSVIHSFCEYMHEHRVQADGKVREPDNFKNGIPLESYMDSMYRHMTQLWGTFDGYEVKDELGKVVTTKDALHGVIFNSMGMLYEVLKLEKEYVKKGD